MNIILWRRIGLLLMLSRISPALYVAATPIIDNILCITLNICPKTNELSTSPPKDVSPDTTLPTLPSCGFNVTTSTPQSDRNLSFLYFYYTRARYIPDFSDTCMCVEGLSNGANDMFHVQFYDNGCSLSEGVCPSPDESLACNCNTSFCTCRDFEHHSYLAPTTQEEVTSVNTTDTCTFGTNLGTYVTTTARTCYPTSGYGHVDCSYLYHSHNCTLTAWTFCICNQDNKPELCDCDSVITYGENSNKGVYATTCATSTSNKDSSPNTKEVILAVTTVAIILVIITLVVRYKRRIRTDQPISAYETYLTNTPAPVDSRGSQHNRAQPNHVIASYSTHVPYIGDESYTFHSTDSASGYEVTRSENIHIDYEIRPSQSEEIPSANRGSGYEPLGSDVTANNYQGLYLQVL